jgi:hypothetical protein
VGPIAELQARERGRRGRLTRAVASLDTAVDGEPEKLRVRGHFLINGRTGLEGGAAQEWNCTHT